MIQKIIGSAYSCLLVDRQSLLITGNKTIKLISLSSNAELKNVASQDKNYLAAIAPDAESVFVASSDGLLQFSLPSLSPMAVVRKGGSVLSLLVLRKLNKLVFSDDEKLFVLDLNNNSLVQLEGGHKQSVRCIASNSDESFIFTTSHDRSVIKWCAKSWKAVCSAKLPDYGRSLCVWEKKHVLLVGIKDGSLFEFSLANLEFITEQEVHRSWINKIIVHSDEMVMTASSDGYIDYPFSKFPPEEISTKWIQDMIFVSPTRLACACDSEGLKFINIRTPSTKFVPPPVSLTDQIIESLFTNLKSIAESASQRKPLLIKLLRDHLDQLSGNTPDVVPSSNGLVISKHPKLPALERSHIYEGRTTGLTKVFHRQYSLQQLGKDSKLSSPEAILTLFEKRIQLRGLVTCKEDPAKDFIIKELRKGRWVFILSKETKLADSAIKTPATSFFKNGWLSCLISDGEIVTSGEFKSVLEVNGQKKNVALVMEDGTLLTSDRKRYFINLRRNFIEAEF